MIPVPTHCPECGEPITRITDPKSGIENLWCTNRACKGQIREMLVQVAHRDVLELEALGPELASQLSEGGYVLDLGDLFGFIDDCQEVLQGAPDKFDERIRKKGFSAAAIRKLIGSAKQARTRDWDKWLVALNLEGIGKVLAKQLAMALELNSMETLCSKLLKVGGLGLEGFGEKKVEGVLAWAMDPQNKDMCIKLHAAEIRPGVLKAKRVEVTPGGSQPLKGMAICVTGEFFDYGLSREEIHERLKGEGANIKTGVTSKCTHLVVGEGAGRTKLAKAKELGILTLNSAWLASVLNLSSVDKGEI